MGIVSGEWKLARGPLEPRHRWTVLPTSTRVERETIMTYQRDPDGRRRGDYIDRDTSIGWAPIVLALAFVVLLGFLMFGSPSGPPSDRPAVSERSEMPY